MFNQNEQNKKLDWMYKGAGSSVDREDYLLGRSVDKSLEQLNAEENRKQIGASLPPKNHVEHECIPPSIRDYKLQRQLAEQVDLQAKLQEDPLLAIKKREEETRRQFLQNPVQLKKLQKALSKQHKKKFKKKRKHKDLDSKLLEKLHLLKGGEPKKKDKDLDIILMHKFNALKDKLSEEDLKDIMTGDNSSSDSSDDDNKGGNFGLVKADGTKIPLNRRTDEKREKRTKVEERPPSPKYKRKRLTEEEKEAARREMQRNASKREVERAENVRRYRERDAKDVQEGYDRDFVHKELRKSAASSTVESRIRSNRNNIQRSSRDMDSHFSRR